MKVELQCGDSITIPEGCKAIVRGRSVVFEKVEEEVQEFKDGDVLHSTIDDVILIFKAMHGHSRSCFDSYYNNKGLGNERWNIEFFRHATEEERQLLLYKMKEQGLEWNMEEKRVKRIRWRSTKGENYYFLNSDLSISIMGDTYSSMDDEFWDACNYFRTEKQAEEAAKRVQEALRQYHYEIG